jgi:hypothetical protein
MGFREEQGVGCSIGIANKIIADSGEIVSQRTRFAWRQSTRVVPVERHCVVFKTSDKICRMPDWKRSARRQLGAPSSSSS